MPLADSKSDAQKFSEALHRKKLEKNLGNEVKDSFYNEVIKDPWKLWEKEWLSNVHKQIIEIPKIFSMSGVKGPIDTEQFTENLLVRGYFVADVSQGIDIFTDVISIKESDGEITEVVEKFPHKTRGSVMLWRYVRTSSGMDLIQQEVSKEDFSDVKTETTESFNRWPLVAVKLNHSLESFYSGAFKGIIRLENVARHIATDNDRHAKNPLAIEGYKGSQEELEDKFSLKQIKEVVGVKGSVKRLSSTDNTKAIEREYERIKQAIFDQKSIPHSFDELNISGESKKVSLRGILSLAEKIRRLYRRATEQFEGVRGVQTEPTFPPLIPQTSKDSSEVISEVERISQLEQEFDLDLMSDQEKRQKIRQAQQLE